jgi:hypothetical protein
MDQQGNSRFDKAMEMLRVLVETAGGSVEPVRTILSQNYDCNLPPALKDELAALVHTAIRGFFHCALRNIVFADISRIREFYGRTLEQNYPGASPTFMKLARTYWTFKVVLIECRGDTSLCMGLLGEIELNFAGLYFPMRGFFGPSKSQRMETMRKVMEMSGAALDIEDYLRGNPYLR